MCEATRTCRGFRHALVGITKNAGPIHDNGQNESEVVTPAGPHINTTPFVNTTTGTGGQFATIGGHRVPVINTPIAEMTDRHDYPESPNGGMAPIATVK